MARVKAFLPTAIFCLIMAGCSMKTIALHSTAALLDEGAGAIYEEPDPQLARESMASQLKLLETLLRSEPENEKLLVLAAEGFSGYAFLFLEDSESRRAKGLYLRSRDYALQALKRQPYFDKLTEQNLDALEQSLKSAGPNEVPALFWAAFGWAGSINLSKDSPEALAQLPKAVLIMKRVEELSPDFHFAGPELFFASYYASRPVMLGGDLKKAKFYFQEAARRTQGRYLMSLVLQARYYAVAAQDKELFKSLLTQVKESASGAWPNARLTDEIAKLKASALLEKTDDFF